MRNKPSLINLFRKKTLLMFTGVIAISAAVTLALYFGAAFIYREAEPEIGGIFHTVRELMRVTGDMPVFLAVFVILFVSIFFAFTNLYRRPLDELSKALEDLSNGRFDVQISVKPHPNDELAAIAGMVKQTAKRLKKAVAVSEFNEKAKDRLIAGVAHDLRTPLTSVLGYLGLIVDFDRVDEASFEETREYAKVAYEKARRLEALIDEMLTATRFRYGKIKPEKTAIDLVKLAEQIGEAFYPELSHAHATLRLKTAERPVMVNADGELLARALENLINNAVKYGARGEDNFIDIKLFKDGENAYIQVINFGAAINGEALPFLFEPFYRAEREDRDAPISGLGLGLSIVKDIAEAHGGAAGAESTEERTVFQIELPL